jgi:hypothetical protein
MGDRYESDGDPRALPPLSLTPALAAVVRGEFNRLGTPIPNWLIRQEGPTRDLFLLEVSNPAGARVHRARRDWDCGDATYSVTVAGVPGYRHSPFCLQTIRQGERYVGPGGMTGAHLCFACAAENLLVVAYLDEAQAEAVSDQMLEAWGYGDSPGTVPLPPPVAEAIAGRTAQLLEQACRQRGIQPGSKEAWLALSPMSGSQRRGFGL